MGHWYDTEGAPHHICLNASKSTKDKSVYRDTTKADARKNDWFPSATGVLKTGKPDWLVRYDNFLLWETIRTERRRGSVETLERYRARITAAFRTESKKPSKLGTKIHGWIEDWLDPVYDHEENEINAPYLNMFRQWQKTSVSEVIATEQSFCSPEWGYGGTVDLQHLNMDKALCITDYKSKKTTPDKEIEQTLDQKRQLVAYALGLEKIVWGDGSHSPLAPDEAGDSFCCDDSFPILGNLYLSTTEPGRWQYITVPPEEIPDLILDVRDLVRLWKRLNNF